MGCNGTDRTRGGVPNKEVMKTYKEAIETIVDAHLKHPSMLTSSYLTMLNVVAMLYDVSLETAKRDSCHEHEARQNSAVQKS